MAMGCRMAARLALALTFCTVLSSVATIPAGKAGEITMYWGQNLNEGSLRKACDSNLYSTVIISFLTNFGGGKYYLDLAGHSRSKVGPDVKYCQSRSILVLLSIGSGTERYSLSSKTDAKAVADHLWDIYLGGRSNYRSFGNAVLDGIDFDIEIWSSKHYDDLVWYLKEYSKKGKKKVWITAALQCPFPDRMLGDALQKGLFDRVHHQFHNNPVCRYRAGNEAAFSRVWNKWTSNFPGSSVYVGLPPAADAVWNGYVKQAKLVSKVLPVVHGSWNYGGIMLWSRYLCCRQDTAGPSRE